MIPHKVDGTVENQSILKSLSEISFDIKLKTFNQSISHSVSNNVGQQLNIVATSANVNSESLLLRSSFADEFTNLPQNQTQLSNQYRWNNCCSFTQSSKNITFVVLPTINVGNRSVFSNEIYLTEELKATSVSHIGKFYSLHIRNTKSTITVSSTTNRHQYTFNKLVYGSPRSAAILSPSVSLLESFRFPSAKSLSEHINTRSSFAFARYKTLTYTKYEQNTLYKDVIKSTLSTETYFSVASRDFKNQDAISLKNAYHEVKITPTLPPSSNTTRSSISPDLHSSTRKPSIAQDLTLPIVTGVVGGLIFLVLLAILIVLLRRKKQSNFDRRSTYIYGAHDRIKNMKSPKRPRPPRTMNNPEYNLRNSTIFGKEKTKHMINRLNSNAPRRNDDFISRLNSQEIESPAHQPDYILTNSTNDINTGRFVKVIHDGVAQEHQRKNMVPLTNVLNRENSTSSSASSNVSHLKTHAPLRPYYWQIEANVYEELSPTADYPDVVQPAGSNPLDIRSNTTNHPKRIGYLNLQNPKYMTTQLV